MLLFRKPWIDLLFVIAILAICVAGGRGFNGYFVAVFALSIAYLVLHFARWWKSRRKPSS